MGYADALHVYGLSRAGYVPQLFSVRLPNPDVIFELLKRSDAKALIYDAAFESILSNSPVPTLAAISEQQVDCEGEALPTMPEVSAEDIAFVFHTSGSTSGSPKLVPCSYQWLDATVRKSYQTCQPSEGRRDVTVWMFVFPSVLKPLCTYNDLQGFSHAHRPDIHAHRQPPARHMHHPAHRDQLFVERAHGHGDPMRAEPSEPVR